MFGLFKRKKSTADESEPWVVAQGSEKGFRVLFRYRGKPPAGVLLSDYPRLVNIYWSYVPGREGAMPGSEDYERMLELESSLEEIETTGAGYLVLSITGNSRKEWVMYSRSDEAFLEQFNVCLQGKPSFPVELETASDPAWASYYDVLALVREA